MKRRRGPRFTPEYFTGLLLILAAGCSRAAIFRAPWWVFAVLYSLGLLLVIASMWQP